MERPSFIVASGDLFIIFIYGAALTYISTFVAPVDLLTQQIASGLLAFVLACLGPDFDEILEWIFFFALGIFVASLAPEIQTYYLTGTYSLEQILLTCKNTWPYALQLLFVWIYGMPPGLIFAKITQRFGQRSYYRHARFY